MADKGDEKKVLLRNRKARHDYLLEETFEAGLVLLGSEVKSLRESQGSLLDAYGDPRGGELWLVGAKVNPYPWANQFNHEPERPRKLLLKRPEIKRIITRIRERGMTLVPTEIYVRRGKIKVELALARGKQEYEKRNAKREREADKDIDEGRGR
jgi:SsrA-binding protein